MVLGKEHVPETNLLSLLLQTLQDGGGGGPSLLAFTELGCEDGIGGDAVFFNEFLDLGGMLALDIKIPERGGSWWFLSWGK